MRGVDWSPTEGWHVLLRGAFIFFGVVVSFAFFPGSDGTYLRLCGGGGGR